MNQRSRPLTFLIAFLVWLVGLVGASAIAGAQEIQHAGSKGSGSTKKKLVLAHYLPWHACSPRKNQYGWHWTMNQFDPSQTDADGLPTIASHYHPLIGPYDGNDPDLIDYHLQLMKLANIDGFILDWYGVSEHNDYPQIHQMACRFVERATEFGFQFAVCYEDRVLVDSPLAKLPRANQRASVAKDLIWLQQHWFRQKNYVRVANRPLVLNFGPIALQADDWKALRTEVKPFPQLYTLPHLMKQANAEGCFQWIPVHGGKATQPTDWKMRPSGL